MCILCPMGVSALERRIYMDAHIVRLGEDAGEVAYLMHLGIIVRPRSKEQMAAETQPSLPLAIGYHGKSAPN